MTGLLRCVCVPTEAWAVVRGARADSLADLPPSAEDEGAGCRAGGLDEVWWDSE